MKTLKLFVALFLLTLFAVSVNACGDSKDGNTSSEEKDESRTIEMEDIVWNVDEGIVDGERYILLDFANKTDYTITGLEITFTEKPDVSGEVKDNYLTDLKEKFEFDDEDVAEIKEKEIAMHAETEQVVEPGETSEVAHCYYYSGYYYVRDINHYKLVEPDIATIQYIDDDKMYTAYYDFTSEKFSVEDDPIVAYQWSDTGLGKKVPKPDAKVVEKGTDDEGLFTFDAFGLSLEQFNAYVEECKTLGYTVDVSSHEGSYTADDAEGYNVYLYYEENDDVLNCTVTAPEQ